MYIYIYIYIQLIDTNHVVILSHVICCL